MRIHLFAAASLLALVPLVAGAQRPSGTPKHRPIYDQATEVTVKGTVETVTQHEGRRDRSGTHLALKTEKETFDVHVGPSWYLTQNKISFAKGDHVEVIGSQVKIGDANVLLAREIKKGEQTITLRNAQGIPLWSRGPRS
ncbi:MAG TPA: hypothetical protein VEU31_09550 [Candidatus Acidoferrales bacterium]|nr:hypothetical protein [Candidatus Acidoferrales bacterium]